MEETKDKKRTILKLIASPKEEVDGIKLTLGKIITLALLSLPLVYLLREHDPETVYGTYRTIVAFFGVFFAQFFLIFLLYIRYWRRHKSYNSSFKAYLIVYAICAGIVIFS